MSEIRTSRQFIVDFLEKNKELMGGIEAVQTQDGRTINLNDMTDEEASEAAEMLMTIGSPTRLGALMKGK
jgi:predicted butyrate kinase (DUF1464 family)